MRHWWSKVNSLGLVLLASSCGTLTIQDERACAAAGKVLGGANCTHTLSDEMEKLTFAEFLEFLQASPEHPDPKDPTKKIPARGAAIAMLPDAWNRMKTDLELACRLMGPSCTFDIKAKIQSASKAIDKLTTLGTLKKGLP